MGITLNPSAEKFISKEDLMNMEILGVSALDCSW